MVEDNIGAGSQDTHHPVKPAQTPSPTDFAAPYGTTQYPSPRRCSSHGHARTKTIRIILKKSAFTSIQYSDDEITRLVEWSPEWKH